MEQSGISIISPPGITENNVNKSKSIGITLRSNSSIKNAKEKLKAPWLKKLMQEDATIRDSIVVGLGEVIGTAILVFLGCMGCVGSMGVSPPVMQISLSFGLAVMIAIQSVGHISGAHINPAVTMAALTLGRISLPMTGLYIVAQCVGGILGYGMLKIITPLHLLNSGNPLTADSFCMTDVHNGLSVVQGLITETIGTGILALFACGAWDIRNSANTDSVALRFGFCVSVLCFVLIPYTGCSINPARTIGPAIWNGYWANHWVYWIGPIGGAVLAALIYRCMFLPKPSADTEQETANLSGVET